MVPFDKPEDNAIQPTKLPRHLLSATPCRAAWNPAEGYGLHRYLLAGIRIPCYVRAHVKGNQGASRVTSQLTMKSVGLYPMYRPLPEEQVDRDGWFWGGWISALFPVLPKGDCLLVDAPGCGWCFVDSGDGVASLR